jgi:hypothetical protein
MRKRVHTIVGLLWLLAGAQAWAVAGVNPFGVNVRSNGPTTVFLTFQNLDAGELPVEALWCGELQPALMAADPTLQLPIPVQITDPCVPGSVFGRLPLQLNRARLSTSGAFSNLTDIMTIPASVARRAYQDAAAGAHSAFFYVRRFSGPAGDRFVVVTCRMAGGGARVALALMDVRLAFDGPRGGVTELAVQRGVPPPPFAARILYNGSGTLRGRWEVMQPGDPEPSEQDLLTQATLPVELRARQRRYTLVDRFDVFLPPTGDVLLRGPDPARLPHDSDGAYKLLLRIEASDDKEATSNTGGGRLALAGGVAGFPMPVLRYHVGSGDTLGRLAAGGSARAPVAVAPAEGATSAGDLTFSWVDSPGAHMLRLEVRDAAGDNEVLAAFVKPGQGQYAAPPWFAQAQQGKSLRWRVVALDASGAPLAQGPWRTLSLR